MFAWVLSLSLIIQGFLLLAIYATTFKDCFEGQ